MTGTPSNPDVSIVIPTWQRAHLIEETLRSALAQTYPSFEVIVTDNASTDGTLDVAERVAAGDPRVRFLRNDENVGPVRNWVRGIEAARGRFVKLLFSDDLLRPSFLAMTMPLIAGHGGVGFVFSAVEIGRDVSSCERAYEWHEHSGVFPSSEFLALSLDSGGRPLRTTVPVSPGAAVFRRTDALRSLKIAVATWPLLHGHGAGPDLFIYLHAARCYPSVAFRAERLCFFRAHPESITIQGRPEVWNGYSAVRRAFRGAAFRGPYGLCLRILNAVENRRTRNRLLHLLGAVPAAVLRKTCRAAFVPK